MLEKTAQTAIIKSFEKAGWWVGINNPEGDPGRPDLLCINYDSFFWLELKTESELRPQQNAWIADYTARGGRNIFVLRIDDDTSDRKKAYTLSNHSYGLDPNQFFFSKNIAHVLEEIISKLHGA